MYDISRGFLMEMELTSRAVHFLPSKRTGFAVDEGILRRLHEAVQSRLSVPLCVGPTAPTTARTSKDGSTEHLRLVSGSEPAIMSFRRNDAVLTSRILEDTPAEEVRRQRMATESAIELPDISYYLQGNLSRQKCPSPRLYEALQPFNDFANIALLRSAHKDEHVSHRTLLTIYVHRDVSLCATVERKRRKRHQVGAGAGRPKERIRARFYEPPIEIGGKSAGYAMGWRLRGHENGKYVRSKMGKGIQASSVSM